MFVWSQWDDDEVTCKDERGSPPSVELNYISDFT